MELLKKVASLKPRYLKTNYYKFMTKKLGKPIMLRTKLQNQFLRKRQN